MATATKRTSPFEFLGEILAAAAGGHFTPAKYQTAVDDLVAAALKDPQIEIVVVLRKGDDVALLGGKSGRLVTDNDEFERILRPIVNRL
ncbi:hypothetical protein A3A05_02565 [Candidatus Nomurabacteria bacterium RIFCSPLOWO2_01_FULL_41_12]|uniref:Uncharacterized protein n=1 Tax=Candidatus Nomurabacteria bacterium RIFCSPLOWO2_01_FULL_41_12 TaxID=1801774 RepID=A0A1F6WVS1_9BACT|nr:MAG: hypothetical protein A3A05_02565 [Candidatus Nomurabacteria bacterium RIFCSPLOWO2_01_FULL_41_12]